MGNTATLQSKPTASVQVRAYQPQDAQKWDAFVQHFPAATFCHWSGWGRVIERVWQHKPYHLLAESNGEVQGVLPLFHVKSRLFDSLLVSSPNAVYGGVVAATEEARQALLAEAKQLAKRLQVDYLEMRDTREASVDRELQRKDLYFTFAHPITTDEDALMKTFPRDIRTMIRKGAKNGLVAELGRENLLDEFYEVYATSLRNLGTPVFPKRLFAEFLREFPQASDILMIRHEGKVAGSVFSFYFRDTVMPYYAGAYADFYRAGINNFMYWELMRSAAARGYTRFDFGRSKTGTGAYEFKRGWGMEATPLPYHFYLVRAQEMPNLNPTNPKFELMIKVWKQLPLSVTKMVGPIIVKNLP
ncbi:MAG: FemAB family XrtA/PEP-CTERM system-associated protein [Blastocatellia bacterium]